MRRALAALLLLLATLPAAAAPDRSRPPQVGAPPSLVLPEVAHRQLSNGIPLWIVRRAKVPMASVVLLVRSGAAQDPAGRFGLAALTADLLDEGAGSRDALQFADAVDLLGADLSVGPGYDATLVELTVPSARLAAGLDLVADAVLRATFAQAELDRSKAEGLTGFLQMRRDPGSLASAAFLNRVFGPEHRYGAGSAGTAAQFAALTRQDVVDFHARGYRPDRVVFLVAGDVDPERVQALLEERFGAWKAGEPGLPTASSSAPAATAGGIFLVDRPGSPQSVLRVGQVGVPRSTPDYFPLEVLNTVLGGSFSSRLNQNLRERNQFTYGVRSGFAMRLGPGPFVVSTSVQSQSTGRAVAEILAELEAIRRPIPSVELERSRNYAAYGFPSGFETSEDLAMRLAELQLYGLPEDYYSKYVSSLLAVTPATAEKAARERLDPGRMVIVVVGDAQSVQPQLEALGLGPVHVLPVDDFMGPEVPVP